MTDNTQAEALAALIERFRGLHIDHKPDGWPAVRTREITALLDRIADLEAQLEAIGACGVSAHKLLTVAERNIRSFLRSAQFKGEPDREAALNCVDVLWAAARAPAQSVTAPSETTPHPACKPDMLVNGGALILALNVLRRAGKHEVAGELEATAQPTPTAQADSVQEDAALWHWLAEYLVGTRTDLDDEIVASETVNDLRKLVEAARKQGATP